jgi:hypothetical protein
MGEVARDDVDNSSAIGALEGAVLGELVERMRPGVYVKDVLFVKW